MPTLAELVSAALPASSPLKPAGALDDFLRRSLADAQTAWPGVAVPDAPLAAHFARHLLGLDASGLERMCGADLVLAAGCAHGAPLALARFDALLKVEVARAVGPLDSTQVDEVTQLARQRLLVADGGPPRIATYAGQGPLAAWVRASAVRLALNARRPGAREEPVSSLPDAPLADGNPELALLRARHRDDFRRAFEAAVKALTPRERTVLRLSTLDGLTLAHIGAMYGKDASTISRWLDAARATLLEHTRRALVERLALSSGELDSVMRAADSELHLSLARLLQSSTG